MTSINDWNNRAIFLRDAQRRLEREAAVKLEEAKRFEEAAEGCIAEASRLAAEQRKS